MIDRNHYAYYQTKSLGVFPYMPGCSCYVDGMLPFLYRRTREEGKINSTFCGDDINMDSFVEFFVKRKTMQVLCRIEEDNTLKPEGYSWVDSPVGVDGARSAVCGFCFFNGASKKSDARDLGMLGIAYWMEALRIDIIHGISLESNIPARNYASHLGFKEVCIVPKRHFNNGSLEGARVMILEKPDFMTKFDAWFEPLRWKGDDQNPVAPQV